MVHSELQEQGDSVVQEQQVRFSEYGPEPPQEAVLMACPALVMVQDLLVVRVPLRLSVPFLLSLSLVRILLPTFLCCPPHQLAVVRVVRLGLRNDPVVALLLIRGERYTGHLGFFACMIYQQFAHDMTLR